MQEREGAMYGDGPPPQPAGIPEGTVYADVGSPDPRSNPQAYAGIVLTAAERARAIAAQLRGAERRGALRVAEDIERWAEQVTQQNP